MTKELKIFAILFILILMITILRLVKKDKITIRYSLVWLIPSFILLLFTLIPGFLNFVTKFLGFKTASNMIFAVVIVLLIIITIALTVIVSKQKEQIKILIQEVSIIKEKSSKNGK